MHRKAFEGAVLLLAALLVSGCGGEAPPKGKLVVIGLDGATWELLQPWIDRGDLPTLASLQENWAWGELQSSVPYLSPPAWTTAVTGVNPGKHAIFDFQRRLPDQSAIVNETAKSRRAQPIWNMLAPSDRRVLLMNIPMTDPPDPVNGLFIAGFPHGDHVGFTHPPELEERLHDYVLDELQIKLVEQREDSLIAVYHHDIDVRKGIVLDWLANEPFDLMYVVFTATDRIQHTFWGFTDKESPHWNDARAARFGNAMHDLWVAVDRALGEILAQIGPEVTTMVLSDHGFGPIRYDLKVKNLLAAPDAGFTEREIGSIYSLDPNDGSRLYVARKGRDPNAPLDIQKATDVRRRLVELLRNATDPATGQKICEAVWVNEKLFSGTYAELGPDVLVLPARGYFLVLGDLEPDAADPYVVPHTDKITAWHRMNGIYAMNGPAIRRGKRNGDGERLYSLIDLVPTMLYTMDEPIPEGLDGELMRGVIDPAQLQAKPPTTCGPLEEDYREMTPEEIQNLRNLPYIGG